MQEISTRTIEYTNVIVDKPWGYEYLMFQSSTIGIWALHINEGSQTSLHCHPRKKTGLILVHGEAQIGFLNNSTALRAVDKLMIRPGLFHSTKTVSPGGIDLIEVENPPDKVNLVRLDDAYGRAELPYEGVEAQRPMPEDCIHLTIPTLCDRLEYSMKSCALTVERVDTMTPLQRYHPDDLMLIVEGGIYSREGEPVLSEGDVVTRSTIDRLAGAFPLTEEMVYMVIKKREM
jgi:mannose-6-phosphate isomerase-like protein (cupin superfamily)